MKQYFEGTCTPLLRCWSRQYDIVSNFRCWYNVRQLESNSNMRCKSQSVKGKSAMLKEAWRFTNYPSGLGIMKDFKLKSKFRLLKFENKYHKGNA